MASALDPARPIGGELHRVAMERLDEAVAHLDAVRGAPADTVTEAIHAARKCCKEVRAIARLVRAEAPHEYAVLNTLVRDAARQLSALRDAHAVLSAVDTLAELDDAPDLTLARSRQADQSARAAEAVSGGEPRVERARELLCEARARLAAWQFGGDPEAVIAGLRRVYRSSRRAWRRALDEPSAEHLHAWRRQAKYLWYQVCLLEPADPGRLGRLAHRLGKLGDRLGDNHDLSVLVATMRSDPGRFGGRRAVDRAVSVARARQRRLRKRAFRTAGKIWVAKPGSFAERVGTAWRRAAGADSIERERKFLVAAVPDLEQLDPPTRLRQGYLSASDGSSTRVRQAGPGTCTLTVKAGTGASRVELELPITAAQFDAAWPHTAGRRIDKRRYRIAWGDRTIELDVFDDALAGFVLAEVEFPDEASMAAFEPPGWFGDEVTGDRRYQNAVLAGEGAPGRAMPS